jgi:hypothetical protein
MEPVLGRWRQHPRVPKARSRRRVRKPERTADVEALTAAREAGVGGAGAAGQGAGAHAADGESGATVTSPKAASKSE